MLLISTDKGTTLFWNEQNNILGIIKKCLLFDNLKRFISYL